MTRRVKRLSAVTKTLITRGERDIERERFVIEEEGKTRLSVHLPQFIDLDNEADMKIILLFDVKNMEEVFRKMQGKGASFSTKIGSI